MIIEYTIEQKEQWDEIVHSFSDYDIFYLSDYSKAFMRDASPNGVPILLYYENGNDKAMNIVFKRDVAFDEKMAGKIEKDKYFDLITPYGYGGFWGCVSNWDKLIEDYTSYCLNKHYICEFVRFELFSDYYAYYNGKVLTRTRNVVRSLSLPIDEIWMDFKQKVRKNVKKANLVGLEIIKENSDDHLDDFLRIYYGTMDRNHAKDDYYFSKLFFRDLTKMENNVMYFHVVYRGKIVSTELVIYGSENCYSFLGGTDREYFDLRPNDFLKYEIIKWAKEKGLKNFVLGGGYGADDGIFQYKLSFAPHGLYNYYIGSKIFDKITYEKLIGLRAGETMNPDYFPIYRS